MAVKLRLPCKCQPSDRLENDPEVIQALNDCTCGWLDRYNEFSQGEWNNQQVFQFYRETAELAKLAMMRLLGATISGSYTPSAWKTLYENLVKVIIALPSDYTRTDLTEAIDRFAHTSHVHGSVLEFACAPSKNQKNGKPLSAKEVIGRIRMYPQEIDLTMQHDGHLRREIKRVLDCLESKNPEDKYRDFR